MSNLPFQLPTDHRQIGSVNSSQIDLTAAAAKYHLLAAGDRELAIHKIIMVVTKAGTNSASSTSVTIGTVADVNKYGVSVSIPANAALGATYEFVLDEANRYIPANDLLLVHAGQLVNGPTVAVQILAGVPTQPNQS